MNRSRHPAAWIAPLLAAVFATAPLAAFESVDPYHKTPIQKEYETALPTAGAATQIATALLAITDEAELEKRLAYLACAAQDVKAYAVIGEISDVLLKRGELRAAIIAADLLLNCSHSIKSTSFGTSKELLEFPGDLCRRAGDLLDHQDPVVQAMGEWMIALRVKKQNAASRELSKKIKPAAADAVWYERWQARPRERMLGDDYARQLVQLNLHRSLAGVAKAVADIDRRRKLLSDAPASGKDAVAGAAYEKAKTQAQQAAAGSDLAAAHAAYIKLRLAARAEVMAVRKDFPSDGFAFFTSPALPNGTWNINVAVADGPSPDGDIFRKASPDPAVPAEPVLKGELGPGSLHGLDLDWEGKNILFSFWHKVINPKAPRGYDSKNAHLYRMPLAGGERIQLTDKGGDNDIEPRFLPDGSYVFASDRSSFGNQCAGPFIQDKRCTTLFRLDPRKGKEPIAISNNKDFDRNPHVMNDGTIVFTHWEYQERGLYATHALWRCRPDGTNMDAFFKQHISAPQSIRDARQIPGSDLCVATAQGHHSGNHGPVILFNPSMGINNEAAMWTVTRGVTVADGNQQGTLLKQFVAEGGVENKGGSFAHPFPLSEKTFLVSSDLTGNMSEYAIYYIDVWGNRELLHRDPDMSCFVPIPLRPRQRPPVIADTVQPDAPCAIAFVENVYGDLPGVAKGTVKYLRMSESLPLPAPVDYDDPTYRFNHLHWLPGDATSSHFSYWTWSPSRTIGIVDVAPDGSSYFKVPAGRPVYLQALDENYCEVRRMRTSFTLQRGEMRSCTGCHESRLTTVGTRTAYPQETLRKGPQTPVPPSWGEGTVLDYRKHIQPIFDRHCISCHGTEKPQGGIELTAREIGGFAQGYRSLFGLKPGDPTPVNEMEIHRTLHPEAAEAAYVQASDATKIHKQMQLNTWPGQLVAISNRLSLAEITQPYQFGSNKSRLIRVLLDGKETHKGLRQAMGAEAWLTLVTWVDYNANYHSTLMDKTGYTKTPKTIKRVPYELPSPWLPGDSHKLYNNQTGFPAKAGL